MSDAREKIINDVVPKVWAEYGSLTRSADAILSAMPEIVAGMVKPLEWYDTVRGQTSQSRLHWYELYENSKGTYTLDDGEAVYECQSMSDGYSKAQKHHTAQILSTLNLK